MGLWKRGRTRQPVWEAARWVQEKAQNEGVLENKAPRWKAARPEQGLGAACRTLKTVLEFACETQMFDHVDFHSLE